MDGLGGKVAVVTGGATGIGRAAAAVLVESGVQVLIVGRRGGRLEGAPRAPADLADDGIRVTAVCPGYVETEMTTVYLREPATRRRIEEDVPLGRVGAPEEVGAVIAFLLSDRSSYVTGAIVTVDGGRTAGWVGALE